MNENKTKGNLRYLYEDKDSDGNSILRYKGEDGAQHYVVSKTDDSGDTGVVTSVKINNDTKTPTDGVVDLGTVVTEVKTINNTTIAGNGNISLAEPVTEVSVSGATPEQTLAPNTFYKFTTPVTSFSGITLGAAITGIVNFYAFSFSAGANDVNPISGLAGVSWANGFEPDLASGDYCEVIIKDNIATFISYTAP